MSRLPKYSIAILVAQGIAIIACVVLLILDEYRLYAYIALPLMASFAIQYYRIRRARQRLDRAFDPFIIDLIQQVIVEYRHRELTLHEPQHDMDDDLKDLREEIERHTLAKAE